MRDYTRAKSFALSIIVNILLLLAVAVFIVPKKLTATGIVRCITLFRITSVWYRKERLLKRQNFATRPVPYPKSAAGYVHRTVFVKVHVL